MVLPKSEGGLGFRDIYAFNLAMLAKQGWRLIQNPDSLCARVLKAKYFADCCCLDAKPKAGMSYTWRSILNGIELLRKGVIWRLGDGHGLNMWKDPWLPWDGPRLPLTPRGRNVLTEISELIDPATGDWDVELVTQTFVEKDVRLILALPVHEGRDNVLAWHCDPKGMFTVRSAYKLYRADTLNKRTRGGNCSSSSTQPNLLWKKIWRVSCPNKLKHFIWRMTHNSHPLRNNLKHRGMKVETQCVVCSRLDEDGAHLFFKCKYAKQFWELAGLETVREALAALRTPREVTEFILAMEEEKIKTIVLLWSWWSERNRIREGEGRRDVAAVAHNALVYSAEILKEYAGQPTVRVRQPKRWERPEVGVLKINCDASFSPQTALGGWGFIIRDDDGDVVTAGCGRIAHLLDAFQAEVVACLHGVQAATDLGIAHVLVETDAVMVQQAVTSDAYDLSAAGGLLVELKEIAAANFISFSVAYQPRECNKVAHALAALGSERLVGDNPIVDTLPSCIRSLIAGDLLANE